MSTSFSPNTLIIDSDDPAEVDRLNADLHSRGQGRPLGTPLLIGDGRLVVPVTGDGVDAERALKLLDAVRPGNAAVREASLENDTIKLIPASLSATSKDIGHGSSFAEITKTTATATKWQPVPAGLRRPVVALLDTGVKDHSWLPAGGEGDPFLIHADKVTDMRAWQPEPLLGNLVLHPEDFDLHEEGHATFIAGLILAASPSTRILSVQVMNEQGSTRESIVNAALAWLLEYREAHPVDVVCMPFGRKRGQVGDAQDLSAMRKLLEKLAAAGVQLVASAGNDHQSVPVYPAGFDVVTAVGAGFGGYHAAFSNHGSWVDRYRDGVGVFGIFPGDIWARWSGTSFAAANFAGDLARPHVNA